MKTTNKAPAKKKSAKGAAKSKAKPKAKVAKPKPEAKTKWLSALDAAAKHYERRAA